MAAHASQGRREATAGRLLAAPRPPRRKPADDPGTHDLAERLSHTFDTKVRVEMGQRKGRIVVEFGSAEDLERIASLMGGTLG